MYPLAVLLPPSILELNCHRPPGITVGHIPPRAQHPAPSAPSWPSPKRMTEERLPPLPMIQGRPAFPVNRRNLHGEKLPIPRINPRMQSPFHLKHHKIPKTQILIGNPVHIFQTVTVQPAPNPWRREIILRHRQPVLQAILPSLLPIKQSTKPDTITFIK